jgi:hypothetical protein
MFGACASVKGTATVRATVSPLRCVSSNAKSLLLLPTPHRVA